MTRYFDNWTQRIEIKNDIVTARIKTYAGGQYGRSGEYIARIIPRYFKNGKMVKSDFQIIEVLEVIKKGYHYPTARYEEKIDGILVP